jgi:hypothetical protein
MIIRRLKIIYKIKYLSEFQLCTRNDQLCHESQSAISHISNINVSKIY